MFNFLLLSCIRNSRCLLLALALVLLCMPAFATVINSGTSTGTTTGGAGRYLMRGDWARFTSSMCG